MGLLQAFLRFLRKLPGGGRLARPGYPRLAGEGTDMALGGSGVIDHVSDVKKFTSNALALVSWLWSLAIPLSLLAKNFYFLSPMVTDGGNLVETVRDEEGKTRASRLQCYSLNKIQNSPPPEQTSSNHLPCFGPLYS